MPPPPQDTPPSQGSLCLHDTRSRTLQPLRPVRVGQVGVYVCGPTVQAAPHVGHLRSAIAFDVLHRWLLESGYAVTFVRNVTDVDDKIIHDAAHRGEPYWALATRQTRAFDRAYDAVGVLPPTVEPRATGHVPQMVELMRVLLDAGRAYVSDGDVYLAVRQVEDYGQLSGQSLDALRASEKTVAHGHTGAKRDPLDFALWKAAKPGEPSWPTPWGPGRPGWHLECSAMAAEYLGEEFDVHGGGLDLVFPHHENELAQSRSVGHPFARLWVHHGLVTTGGEKMSKSLGNSTVVADVLAQTRPQVLRYALGSAHHRSAVEWGPGTLAEAETAYARLETFVRNALDALGGVPEAEALAAEAPAHPEWAAFAAAMDDDLGVPQALAVLYGLVRQGNALFGAAPVDRLPLAVLLAAVRRGLAVLGLEPVAQWSARAAAGPDLAPVVDALGAVALEARAEARARKDWAAADAVRDRLAAAGVAVEDGQDGARWRLVGRQ